MPLRLILAAAVMVSLFCTAETLCLLPGVQLSLSEAECCRHMAGDCGRGAMPSSHSCCKPVVRNETAVGVKVTSLPSPQLAAAGFPIEIDIIDGSSPLEVHPGFIDHPPPGNPPTAATILRI